MVMKILLILCISYLLSSCSIYQGSYYYPNSNKGIVSIVGSCGDNVPSKLIVNEEDVNISTQAMSINPNDPYETWVWLEFESEKQFSINSLPSAIYFFSGVQEIKPIGIQYFQKNHAHGNVSSEHKTIDDLPDFTGETKYLRIVFRFLHSEILQLKIAGLILSNIKVQDINVNFKNTKAIRISALNC